MNGYVQVRCPRCGNAAWGHPVLAVACQSCGQQVPPQQQAQAPMPPMPQAQAMAPGMPGAGWGSPAPGMGGMPGVGAGMPPGMGAPGMGAPGMGAAPGLGVPGMQVAPGQANPWSAPVASATPAAVPGMSIPLPGGFKLPIKLGGASGGVSMFKILGGVVLMIALAIGGVVFKMKFAKPKGVITYKALGLEKGKADPDRMMTALAAPAKAWHKDAMFWSLNFQAVRADGTVDTSKGAEVVYVSPSASASYAKSQRSNSVKKYAFGPQGAGNKGRWGWNDPVKDLEAPPAPKCTIKDAVALVAKGGLPAGKTVRVTFDPKFADYYAWRVMSDDPKIDTLYSWDDCSIIH